MAGRVEPHPDDILRDELTRLRAAMAKVLREKLESGTDITPAWMDQARKFLTDQGMVRSADRVQVSPAVTQNLPFKDDESE